MSKLEFDKVQKKEQLKIAKKLIVQKLKQTRIQAKMTEDFVAEWLEISRNSLRKLEKGDEVDFDLLMRYGEKFGVDVTIFITFDV